MLGECRDDHKIGFSIGGRDASIIAMMKKYRVKTIITHDRDFIRLTYQIECNQNLVSLLMMSNVCGLI